MKEFPTIRYRMKNGKIEKRVFQEEPPKGWFHSPADLTGLVAPVVKVTRAEAQELYPVPPLPRPRGRPKGSKNRPKDA